MTASIAASPPQRLYLHDRHEAGAALGLELATYAERPDVIVLALPRGGVPVAAAVADALHAPMDVFIVRTLSVPGHPEYSLGALASGGLVVANREIPPTLRLSPALIQSITTTQQRELAQREHVYRDDRPFPDVRGKTVIVVDDGLATGSTMLAAVAALRTLEPARIVVAVPVSSAKAVELLRAVADDIVVLAVPDPFLSVGSWYEDFSEVSDEAIQALVPARISR